MSHVCKGNQSFVCGVILLIIAYFRLSNFIGTAEFIAVVVDLLIYYCCGKVEFTICCCGVDMSSEFQILHEL
jgi:hypothetical protein